MRAVRFNILVCSALLLWQCDNDLYTYELPSRPQQLTVNFVGDNTVNWAGNVSLTRNVLIQNGQFLPTISPDKVSVYLYEDGAIQDTLAPNYCCYGPYVSDFYKPRPGHQYRLDVISEEFGTATAEVTMPAEVFPETFRHKELGVRARDDFHPGAKDHQMEFEVSFKDLPGNDFYEIFIHVLEEPFHYWDINTVNLKMYDPNYKDAVDGAWYNSGGFLMDDRLFDGQTANLTFKTETFYGINELTGEITIYAIAVQIRHLTREYYEYLRSYATQVNTRNDPYAQPINVPNNIQNGFGIFGGYTKTITPYIVD
jgi:hypothetical protein